MKVKTHRIEVSVSVEEVEHDDVYQVKSVGDYNKGDALFYQAWIKGYFEDCYYLVDDPQHFLSWVNLDQQRVFASSSPPLVSKSSVDSLFNRTDLTPFSLNREVNKALRIITENKKP